MIIVSLENENLIFGYFFVKNLVLFALEFFLWKYSYLWKFIEWRTDWFFRTLRFWITIEYTLYFRVECGKHILMKIKFILEPEEFGIPPLIVIRWLSLLEVLKSLNQLFNIFLSVFKSILQIFDYPQLRLFFFLWEFTLCCVHQIQPIVIDPP